MSALTHCGFPYPVRSMPQTGHPGRSAPFDRTLLRARRDRVAKGFSNHDFLVREVCERVGDRLEPINRKFPMALDIGCHNGLMAQTLSYYDGIEYRFQTDISFGMASAARQFADGTLVADEEFLPIADERLDLVTSVLTLHWTNDLPGALIQINRALKPDGLFIAAMFGGETLCELRDSLTWAEIEIDGGLSPRISPFPQLQELGALLQRAGFALPVVDSERITVTYDHPFKLMAELRGMGEANALVERRRTPLRRGTLLAAAKYYQDRFADSDGRIPATFELHFLTGWAPHESQQKPLRPGTAQQRLADALGTVEHAAGDKAPGPGHGKDG